MIEMYGAYLGHLTTLVDDPNTKPVDRQKLKGCILKWRDSKMLSSCAFFHDLLKPSATLCNMLQADDVCVVGALEAIFKTSRSMDKVKSIS